MEGEKEKFWMKKTLKLSKDDGQYPIGSLWYTLTQETTKEEINKFSEELEQAKVKCAS